MISQLVFDFFTLLKLKPLEIRSGIWQVPIDEALMKELDGWQARARLLQFTFEQKLADIYGAELVSAGSYRLSSILKVIRRQGLLSHAHIPDHFFHEPSIKKKILSQFGQEKRAYVISSYLQYEQYCLFQIFWTEQGLTKKESIHQVVVNLFSGEVLKFAIPPHLLKPGTLEDARIRKRRCSLKKAYYKAVEHLNSELVNSERTWILEAQELLHREREKLVNYYEGQTSEAEFKSKLEALEHHFSPTISTDVIRAAILYVPLFCYRLVVVEQENQERIQALHYDPVSNSLTSD